MQNPKVLVIGGSKGIGKGIVDHYDGVSLSRETGHDINYKANRAVIAEESLNFDVVVNHAYTTGSAQTEMLLDIFKTWKEHNKVGYIINTGSVSSYLHNFKVSGYGPYKSATDEVCKQINKEIRGGKLGFRLTNIRPGMLDTPTSREKPHWAGVGVTNEQYCNLIQWLITSPEDQLIMDIVIETKATAE